MTIPSIHDDQLREYQIQNKAEIYRLWEYHRSVMLQMPTGTGKTRLFASVVKDLHSLSAQLGKAYKVLILVHRQELVDQTAQTLGVTYGVAHGIIMSGTRQQMFYPTQIASVQTLNKRLTDWTEKEFDFIIIDEAHHALASSYKKICNTFPKAKILGVTATPYRLSGDSFRVLFQEIVISSRISKFIEEGFLSKYNYYSISPTSAIQAAINNIDTYDIDGDYAIAAMSKVIDTNYVQAKLISSYVKFADGKKGIVYTINKAHNQHVCKAYNEAGYSAVAIDSDTKPDERNKIIQKFRTGSIKILCNVNIFSEGFDCPDIEFIQLARPTTSLSLYLQQVGRGLRIHPDIERVIFLDNVGSYNKYGLPSSYRNWRRYFDGHNPREKDDKEKQDKFSSSICRVYGIEDGEEFIEGNESVDLIYTTGDIPSDSAGTISLSDFDEYEEFQIPKEIPFDSIHSYHFINYDYNEWISEIPYEINNHIWENEIEGVEIDTSEYKRELYEKSIYKVKRNGKWGLLDIEKGYLVLETEYDSIEGCNIFGESIINYDGKFGVLSVHKMELNLDLIYDEIEFIKGQKRFEQYIVKKNDKYGVVNKGDKILQPTIYDEVIAISQFVAITMSIELYVITGSFWHLVNDNNELISKGTIVKAVGDYFVIKLEKLLGIGNANGEILLPFIFETITFQHGFIKAKKRYGGILVLKNDLSLFQNCTFDSFVFVSKSIVICKKSGKGAGIIDVSNESILIDFMYEDVKLMDGIICIRKEYLWHVIDLDHKIYISENKLKIAVAEFKKSEFFMKGLYKTIKIEEERKEVKNVNKENKQVTGSKEKSKVQIKVNDNSKIKNIQKKAENTPKEKEPLEKVIDSYFRSAETISNKVEKPKKIKVKNNNSDFVSKEVEETNVYTDKKRRRRIKVKLDPIISEREKK